MSTSEKPASKKIAAWKRRRTKRQTQTRTVQPVIPKLTQFDSHHSDSDSDDHHHHHRRRRRCDDCCPPTVIYYDQMGFPIMQSVNSCSVCPPGFLAYGGVPYPSYSPPPPMFLPPPPLPPPPPMWYPSGFNQCPGPMFQ